MPVARAPISPARRVLLCPYTRDASAVVVKSAVAEKDIEAVRRYPLDGLVIVSASAARDLSLARGLAPLVKSIDSDGSLSASF